ncbi:hypothetical protein, partial [Anaerovibrio sp.]|uniref:hypothetical protein n=1 Tax=Anaerovibrio sp. TaxID=1872532 RepID=UPI00388EBA65
IKDKLHQLRDNNKLSIAITGQEPTLSMDRVRKPIRPAEFGGSFNPKPQARFLAAKTTII